MVNYNLNLKQRKKQVEQPINLVVRWAGNRLMYSTNEKVHPKHWENDKMKKNFQRVKTSYLGFSEFNQRLEQFLGDARSIFRGFVNDMKRYPTPMELKSLFDKSLRNTAVEKKQNLFQFIESFIKEVEGNRINRDTGKRLSKITISSYKNVLDKLKSFQKIYHRPIDFSEINIEFYEAWISFLTIENEYSQSTVGRYTKILKVLLNEATDRGLNTNLFYKTKRFKVLTENVNKCFLNKEELAELFNLDLTNKKRYGRVRDLLIIGCHTGLRYFDLVSLKKENIQENRITLRTQKTGEFLSLPIHPYVRTILQRYKDTPTGMPPKLSNTKFNVTVKLVAGMCELLKKPIEISYTKGGQLVTVTKPKAEFISSHVCRRSFCSNLYLDGMNSLAIMKLSTHKTEKVFHGYIRANAEQSASLLEKHWEKSQEILV